MAEAPNRRSAGSRIFRSLLRLLPFDFRVEHGPEMEQVFRAQRQGLRDDGTLRAVARLWLDTVLDLIATAPRQHAAILRQDITYTLRALRRTPGFTAAAVLALAIGISGTASIFTIINAFLFRPLPVERPQDLVSIATLGDHHVEIPHGVSFRDLQDYAALEDVFAGLLGYQPDGAWLDPGDGAERIIVEALTDNAFTLLGVRPAAGRLFTPADARAQVVVLSHDYWRTRFGGDASIVGRTVRLNGEVFTVIGVTDERFAGLQSLIRVSAFLPVSALEFFRKDRAFGPDWFENREYHELNIIGRLRPGVAIEQARAALATKVRVLAEQYPATNKNTRLLVVPETYARPLPQNGPMFHVAAAVLALLAGLLLCITSANIANMLLARAASRGREIGLRAALGARSGRIVRQLFTESIVLASFGSAGAVLLAMLAASAMERGLASLTFDIPLRVDFGVDWRVVGATVAVALAAGVISGLAPALYAWRADVNSLLKTGGQREGSERGRLRSLLVVSQVATSIVLLVVGGLFVKTLDRARNTDLGFRSDRVLTARVDLSVSAYDDTRRRVFYRETIERVTNIAGVRMAAWISALPFGYDQGATTLAPEGEVPSAGGQDHLSFSVSVTPEYFALANLVPVAGRAFDARDAADAPRVVIVNEALAGRLWPGQRAVGRRIRLGNGPLVEVVGVVKTGKYVFLWEAPRAMLFRPLAQDTPVSATLEVWTANSPMDVAGEVQTTLRAIDPMVPVYRMNSMANYLEQGQAFLLFRIGALLTGIFGSLGLLLASIGLYGVVAYDVSQRRREIGVRLALGALRADILREVIERSARLAIPGAVIGIALAATIAWSLRTLLMGVSPFDPATYGFTALVLLLVSLLASFVPARHAATASPLDALRAE
jgi:putative ABC transport system permease protein